MFLAATVAVTYHFAAVPGSAADGIDIVVGVVVGGVAVAAVACGVDLHFERVICCCCCWLFELIAFSVFVVYFAWLYLNFKTAP